MNILVNSRYIQWLRIREYKSKLPDDQTVAVVSRAVMCQIPNWHGSAVNRYSKPGNARTLVGYLSRFRERIGNFEHVLRAC